MEKPVLRRGLDSLIAGGAGPTGRRASDMLSSFQAKRTRVAPGLRSLLQGARAQAPQPATPPKAPQPAPPAQPSAPAPQPPSAPKDTRGAMGRLRIRRSPRAKAPPSPARYRPTRPLRDTGAPPEQKKKGDSAAAGGVHSSAEPAFQKPVVRRRPVYLKNQPAPKPPPPSSVSPGFRLSLFVVDWFLLLVGFGLIWFSTPPIGWITLTLCCLAVIAGATLGAWSLLLEPQTADEE